MRNLILIFVVLCSTSLMLSAQPVSYIQYTVKPGDNLYKLSSVYGVNIESIKQHNPRIKNEQLNVGEVIILPMKKWVDTGDPSKSNTQTVVYLNDDVVANAGENLLPMNKPVLHEDPISDVVSEIISKPSENLSSTEPIVYATPLNFADNEVTIPVQPLFVKEDPIFRGVEEPVQLIDTYSATITEANTNTSTSSNGNNVKTTKTVDKSTKESNATTGTAKSGIYSKLKPVKHKVKEKETLYSIAKQYNQEITTIVNWNNLPDNSIKTGQEIIIEWIMPTNEALSMLELAEIGKSNADAANMTAFQKTYLSYELDTMNLYQLKKDIGAAVWFDDSGTTSGTDNMYCLHKNAPPKTIVKVTNPINRRSAYLMVVEKLPDLSQNDNVLLSMTHSAAKRLNILNDKLMVESRYYLPK